MGPKTNTRSDWAEKFSAQSGASIRSAVWNWCVKSLSPGARIFLSYFCSFFPACFDFCLRPHYLPLGLRGCGFPGPLLKIQGFCLNSGMGNDNKLGQFFSTHSFSLSNWAKSVCLIGMCKLSRISAHEGTSRPQY